MRSSPDGSAATVVGSATTMFCGVGVIVGRGVGVIVGLGAMPPACPVSVALLCAVTGAACGAAVGSLFATSPWPPCTAPACPLLGILLGTICVAAAGPPELATICAAICRPTYWLTCGRSQKR